MLQHLVRAVLPLAALIGLTLTPSATALADDSSAASDVASRINRARDSQGLPALATLGDRSEARRANRALADTGDAHGTFESSADWYLAQGASRFGENQAFGAGLSPAGAVELWRSSSAHASTMFDTEHTHVAVSVTRSGDLTFYTAQFATMPGGHESEGGSDSDGSSSSSGSSEDSDAEGSPQDTTVSASPPDGDGSAPEPTTDEQGAPRPPDDDASAHEVTADDQAAPPPPEDESRSYRPETPELAGRVPDEPDGDSSQHADEPDVAAVVLDDHGRGSLHHADEPDVAAVLLDDHDDHDLHFSPVMAVARADTIRLAADADPGRAHPTTDALLIGLLSIGGTWGLRRRTCPDAGTTPQA